MGRVIAIREVEWEGKKVGREVDLKEKREIYQEKTDGLGEGGEESS
jgi:hypothetical protein